MATKEQEKQALGKIRKIVDSLGENSYVGAAMEGVWEAARQNIELDTAFSIEGQKKILEKELESQEQRIEELDGLVSRQRGEMEALYKSMAEAQRLVAKWHISREIYDHIVEVVREKRELEAQRMQDEADGWADSIGEDGRPWTDLKQQADAYKKHREQKKICCDILRVLERYGEWEEAGG